MKLITTFVLAAISGAAAATTIRMWEPAVERAVPQSASYLPALATPPSPSLSATATPADAPPPIVLTIPSPTASLPPSPPAPVPWTDADCRFAIGVLAADAQDDSAAAQNPKYSAAASWYAQEAQRWLTLLATSRAICADSPAYPDAATVTTATAWMTEARGSHVTDEELHGQNAWDDGWIANYTRLLALFAQVS